MKQMRIMNADKTPIRLFNIYGEDRGTGYAGNVWGVDGIAPALTTMGGNREPMIIESNELKTEEDTGKQRM